MQDPALPYLSMREARRDRFAGFVPPAIAGLSYFETLSVQTQTNIDAWNAYECVHEVDGTDRRALNRRFFDLSDKYRQAQNAALPAEEAEALTATLQKAVEASQASRIDEVTRRFETLAGEATRAQRAYQDKVTQAWGFKKELLAIQKTPPEYAVAQVKELVSGDFWEFHSFKNNLLKLATRNDVVMTEINPAAGLNRRVNLGRYIAELRVPGMRMRLLRYKQNLLTRHWHPYVARDGEICWGNAGATATKHLTGGNILEAFNLLASLLCTYSDGTPWEPLSEFDALQRDNVARVDSVDDGAASVDTCEHCDEPEEDCECHFCETCEEHDDNCSCAYCERCETSYRDPCEEHYCSTCGTYDYPDCDCCRDCDRTDNRCTRCRECNRHDGNHTLDCSNTPEF